MSDEPRGGCTLTIYLQDVTDAQVDDLSDRIAGVMKQWSPHEADEAPGVIATRPFAYPEDVDAFFDAHLKDAAAILIPCDPDEIEEEAPAPVQSEGGEGA